MAGEFRDCNKILSKVTNWHLVVQQKSPAAGEVSF